MGNVCCGDDENYQRGAQSFEYDKFQLQSMVEEYEAKYQ